LGIKTYFTRVGSLSCMFFTDKQVLNFETAASTDTKKYARYFREMLNRGIYLAPSPFEACFISTAHTDEDIQRTIEVNREALKKLRQ